MKYVKITKVLSPNQNSNRLLNEVVLVRDDNSIQLIDCAHNLSDFEYTDIPMNEIDNHLVYVGITQGEVPFKTYQ